MANYSEDYRLTMTPAQKQRLEAAVEKRDTTKAQLLREGLMEVTDPDPESQTEEALAEVRRQIEEKEERVEELQDDLREAEEELDELREREEELVAQLDDVETTEVRSYEDQLRVLVEETAGVGEFDGPVIPDIAIEGRAGDMGRHPQTVEQHLRQMYRAVIEDMGTYTDPEGEYDRDAVEYIPTEEPIPDGFDVGDWIGVHPQRQHSEMSHFRVMNQATDNLLDEWEEYWPPG